jgi:hypothetical protein
MLFHRFDAGVQQFGCWALSNLALSGEEIMRKMKKKGAVEVHSSLFYIWKCTPLATDITSCDHILHGYLFCADLRTDLPDRDRDTPKECGGAATGAQRNRGVFAAARGWYECSGSQRKSRSFVNAVNFCIYCAMYLVCVVCWDLVCEVNIGEPN